MKKILKKYRLSNCDDFPMTASHIHLLRILEFVSGTSAFTEKETAHFDVCRVCRLKVIEKLKNLTAPVPAVCGTVCGTAMRKAA